jgi:hypothetical protein
VELAEADHGAENLPRRRVEGPRSEKGHIVTNANARTLERTDRHAANALLTKLDREATDQAIFLPLVNLHFYDFVSARVKHYVKDAMFGLIVDQASLR